MKTGKPETKRRGRQPKRVVRMPKPVHWDESVVVYRPGVTLASLFCGVKRAPTNPATGDSE